MMDNKIGNYLLRWLDSHRAAVAWIVYWAVAACAALSSGALSSGMIIVLFALLGAFGYRIALHWLDDVAPALRLYAHEPVDEVLEQFRAWAGRWNVDEALVPSSLVSDVPAAPGGEPARVWPAIIAVDRDGDCPGAFRVWFQMPPKFTRARFRDSVDEVERALGIPVSDVRDVAGTVDQIEVLVGGEGGAEWAR